MFTFLSKFSLSKMSSIDQEQLEQISDEDKGRVQIPRSHEHCISEESKGDNIEGHTENNHVGLCKTKQNDQRVLRLESDVVKGQKVHNLAFQNNSRSTDSKHYERAVYLSKGQKSTSKLMEKNFLSSMSEIRRTDNMEAENDLEEVLRERAKIYGNHLDPS